MKVYLLSAGVGLLVGLLYSLLNVRSPAPPVVALVGLLGILAGEQIIPAAKRLIATRDAVSLFRPDRVSEPSKPEAPADKDKR